MLETEPKTSALPLNYTLLVCREHYKNSLSPSSSVYQAPIMLGAQECILSLSMELTVSFRVLFLLVWLLMQSCVVPKASRSEWQQHGDCYWSWAEDH